MIQWWNRQRVSQNSKTQQDSKSAILKCSRANIKSLKLQIYYPVHRTAQVRSPGLRRALCPWPCLTQITWPLSGWCCSFLRLGLHAEGGSSCLGAWLKLHFQRCTRRSPRGHSLRGLSLAVNSACLLRISLNFLVVTSMTP